MKYSDLLTAVKASERQLAKRSETVLWGEFLTHMRQLGISNVFEPSDAEIDDNEAQWWLDVYAAEVLLAEKCDSLTDDQQQDIEDCGNDYEHRAATIRRICRD